jgi:hypothetical protein
MPKYDRLSVLVMRGLAKYMVQSKKAESQQVVNWPLDENLLNRVADRLGLKVQRVREKVSRKARSGAYTKHTALELIARDVGVATGAHFKKLSPDDQAQVRDALTAIRGPRLQGATPNRQRSSTSARAPKKSHSRLARFIEHPVISSVIATLLCAAILALVAFLIGLL